jgi:hypothetical protein
VNERQLQDAVVELCLRLKLHVVHFETAQRRGAWVTPFSGMRGFPDTVIVGSRILFRELKAGSNRLGHEQAAWLNRINEANGDAAVWYPDDWTTGRIERELREIA